MKKVRESSAMLFLRKAFTFWIALCFVFGCAGIKSEQKPEQKPAPPVEEKVEQPRKEHPPPPQPAPKPPAKPASPMGAPSISDPPKVTPPSQPLPSPAPSLRTTKIVWDTANLRKGPGLNYKVIGNVKKGTILSILEDKGNWLRVRLEDGKEAWVSKTATSDAPKSPPAVTPKPKPM
jgi:sRNA-binding protein